MGRKRILGCSGIVTGFLTIVKYYTSVKAQSFILSTEITAFSLAMAGSRYSLLFSRWRRRGRFNF